MDDVSLNIVPTSASSESLTKGKASLSRQGNFRRFGTSVWLRPGRPLSTGFLDIHLDSVGLQIFLSPKRLTPQPSRGQPSGVHGGTKTPPRPREISKRFFRKGAGGAETTCDHIGRPVDVLLPIAASTGGVWGGVWGGSIEVYSWNEGT